MSDGNVAAASALKHMAAKVEASDTRAEAQRRLLLKRLMDVVALPSSTGSLQDRAIAGDLLLDVLLEAEPWAKDLCARRLEEMTQAPKRLLRFLALDAPTSSERIIRENRGLDEADLVHIIIHGGAIQRLAVASRRDIGAAVSSALAEYGDARAHEMLLKNRTSVLSDRAIDVLVNASREAPQLTSLLIQRDEIRPAHALAMFWWCGSEERRQILFRFSADRNVLLAECADIFKRVAEDQWADPLVRKAMQVMERRQRNRGALAHSPWNSLEEVVTEAERTGLNGMLTQEISVLSGIRPQTGERILHDQGGEGIAVLCKATGLKRTYFRAMWAAAHPKASLDGEHCQRIETVYDSLAVAKAQTVLRYWNWCMESAFTPDVELRTRSDEITLALERASVRAE